MSKNELIKVELSKLNDETIQSVSARELHNFLEVKSRFNDWIKNKITQYGFIENIDFIYTTKNLVSKSNPIDYSLTINMAKELAMLENNEKGKQARQYFINCEKLLKEKLKQERLRQDLKLENPYMTDAIKDFQMCKGKSAEARHFMNEFKLINRLVLGMETNKYRESHNIPKNANLRDYLMPIQIELILKLQRMNASYLEEGLEYQERKEKLVKIFETKYKPKSLH